MKRINGKKMILPLCLVALVLLWRLDRHGVLSESLRKPSRVPGLASVWQLDHYEKVDGDTIRLADGRKVRLVGIDTPEWDEYGGDAAKLGITRLLSQGAVTLAVCPEAPSDRYGRLLGQLFVEGRDLQAGMLKKGLARSFTLPPCGAALAATYTALFQAAFKAGEGTWKTSPMLAPCDTEAWEKRVVNVQGILSSYRYTQSGVSLYLEDPARKKPRKRGCFSMRVGKRSADLWSGKEVKDRLSASEGKLVRVVGKVQKMGKKFGMIVGHPNELALVSSAPEARALP